MRNTLEIMESIVVQKTRLYVVLMYKVFNYLPLNVLLCVFSMA